MSAVTESIRDFLAACRPSHNGPDLLDRWNPALETQVNVSGGGHPIRIPRKADTVPEWNDYELAWSLSEHAEGIGTTGWDFVNRQSKWVGFDFDAITGHADGIGPDQLEAVKQAAMAVPWVEVRKSTGGAGLHLYVHFEDGMATANHTEHAALARAVLAMLSEKTGFDFESRVDRLGGVLWIWHRKMTAANEGLKLLKAAESKLALRDIPSDWREKGVAKSVAKSRPKSIILAKAAMLRIKIADNNDGSKRVFAYCCRAVEHDLNDDDAIVALRECETVQPFPRDWSDEEIRHRLRDAEKEVERGSAVITKPALNVTCGELDKQTKAVWELIKKANKPPTLYLFGGNPVRAERDENSEPILRSISANEMRFHLAEWIYFYHSTAKDPSVACAPPLGLVNNVLATPEMQLPFLERVVEAPVFGSDGTLQMVPGYHEASRTLFSPKPGFEIPDVSPNPSQREIKQARELIRGDLLGEFPFVNEAARTHAICSMLLPFARGLIDGPTPLHLFEKPAPGTGASLLIDVLTYPAIGRPVGMMTECRDDDEWRKRITAKLRTSPTYLLIDNLRERLDSAALASAITSLYWEDRLLGASQVVRVPVRCAWFASGNNPALSPEMTRRAISIRLDAKMDRPWLRDKFSHPDLRGWAAENRSRLVWAALTLVSAWVAAGRPAGEKTLGMFESWARVMGGILDVTGIPGFMANLGDFYEQADTEGAALRGFLSSWWGCHHHEPVKTSDLMGFAQEELAPLLGAGSPQSQLIRLGKLLSESRDRVFSVEVPDSATVCLRVDTAGKKSRAMLWQLALAA